MSVASDITRKAKSNLAFALNILPRGRREDMVAFSAFCRTMDDLADDPGVAMAERVRSLDAWENGITASFDAPDEFQREVISLRDVGEDLSNGRIYLPTEDLARFQYPEQDLVGRVRDERYLALMAFEAARAEDYFQQAAAALPASDRRALVSARIMGEIYHLLLGKMRDDRFQVFEKRYRISKARKLAIFSKHLT